MSMETRESTRHGGHFVLVVFKAEIAGGGETPRFRFWWVPKRLRFPLLKLTECPTSTPLRCQTILNYLRQRIGTY
jgi:hypothetical protein